MTFLIGTAGGVTSSTVAGIILDQVRGIQMGVSRPAPGGVMASLRADKKGMRLVA